MDRSRSVLEVRPMELDGWQIIDRGLESTSVSYESKEEAVAMARLRAERLGGSVRVFDSGGTMESAWAYGLD